MVDIVYGDQSQPSCAGQFWWTWHKQESTWKRDPPLKNYLRQVGLWALWGRFLDWLLIWEGPAHCGPCLPGQVTLVVAWNKQRKLWRASQEAGSLHSLCFSPCLQFPAWAPGPASLHDGVWRGRHTKPFPSHIAFAHGFITASAKQTRAQVASKAES